MEFIINLIAFYWLCRVLITFVHGIYARLLRSGKNLKKCYGKYALVTGATDGIGKAMAFEFARQKLHVILISRSLDKLQEVAKEIKAKYPEIEVLVLAIDFNQFDLTARKAVADLIAPLDIGILVNNVGISYPYPKYFHELDDERVQQMLTLNVDSTTWMTRLVLPGMTARKRGAIVNIGSAAGLLHSPLLVLYGATKGFMATMSQALNYELKEFGIHVQFQVPLFVATKLAKIKHTSFFVPSPAAYAVPAVAAIGYEKVVSPYWTHAMQLYLFQCLPEWFVDWGTMKMHMGGHQERDGQEGLVNCRA